MVVAERAISVLVKIHANSLEELDNIHRAIRDDFVKKAVAYSNKVKTPCKVVILTDFECSRCGKSASKCKCGNPNKSPAV